MSVNFTIFPARGLVFVRYEGTALVHESARVFGAYARHPDFRPGQKQLVDLQHATGYEQDFPRIFEMQMRKAEVFMRDAEQTLIVYYAPTRTSLSMAHLIARSWDGLNGVITRIVNTSEADALSLLGQQDDNFDALLRTEGRSPMADL